MHINWGINFQACLLIYSANSKRRKQRLLNRKGIHANTQSTVRLQKWGREMKMIQLSMYIQSDYYLGMNAPWLNEWKFKRFLKNRQMIFWWTKCFQSIRSYLDITEMKNSLNRLLEFKYVLLKIWWVRQTACDVFKIWNIVRVRGVSF